MARIVVSFGRDQKLPPYAAALAAAGLAPADVVPVSPAIVNGATPGDFLHGAGGLLLTGGCDLEPALYGETPDPRVRLDTPMPSRDRLELALLAEARERRLPVLGICRGLQLMNVALGGSLWQDLAIQGGLEGHDLSTDAGHPPDRLAHAVVAGDSEHPAREWIVANPQLVVNSRHHQAVRRASDELVTVATAPDGVVEAMAARDLDWWAWGVQWHPENLVDAAPHRELFRRFLGAAEEAR